MIWQDVLNYQWSKLAGRDTRELQRNYVRQRIARVRQAQRFQNFFLAAIGSSVAGTVGETFQGQTPPLRYEALVVDGFTVIPATQTEVSIIRTNPSRSQVSKEFLQSLHYVTRSLGETGFLEPMPLAPNELLQARFRLQFATGTPGENAVVFRVIGLNREECPPEHWREIESYIRCTPEQYPIYLPAFPATGKTLVFPAAAADQNIVAFTREVDAPCLITGMGRNALVAGDTGQLVKIKIRSSEGHIFTPQPIPWGGLPNFAGYADQGPGGGWEFGFEFPIPHYLPRGGTISCEFSDATPTATTLANSEVMFRGVTI